MQTYYDPRAAGRALITFAFPPRRGGSGLCCCAVCRAWLDFWPAGAAAYIPVLGINGRLFWPWLIFASQMMPFGRLPATDREKVILRVAWHCRSRYEWGQHVEMALKVGVSDNEIIEITKPSGDILNQDDRLLVKVCDQLCQQRPIDEDNWLALNQKYNKRQMIELVMLVGHYVMVAGLLINAGIELETATEKTLQGFYARLPKG